METNVEVRFYCAEKFKGAKRDASGWYQSINFLPANISDLNDFPEYDSVIIIYALPDLPSTYIDNWSKAYPPDAATVKYDGMQVIVAASEYSNAKDALDIFLRDAKGGKSISLEK